MQDFADIGADKTLAARALEETARKLEELEAAGVYSRHNLAQEEYSDLAQIQNNAGYVGHNLKIMKRSWDIDMGDFEIRHKGGLKGTLEYWTKKICWTLMKFYSFRMFTQTKAYNLQAVTALSSLSRRLDKIEKRLEGR
jgi:hypothetical protein